VLGNGRKISEGKQRNQPGDEEEKGMATLTQRCCRREHEDKRNKQKSAVVISLRH